MPFPPQPPQTGRYPKETRVRIYSGDRSRTSEGQAEGLERLETLSATGTRRTRSREPHPTPDYVRLPKRC